MELKIGDRITFDRLTAKTHELELQKGVSEMYIVVGGKGYYPKVGGSKDGFIPASTLPTDVCEAVILGSMFGWHVPGAQHRQIQIN